ncbi:AmmeMemoRadiSam system radical SAM enzyme [Clostridium sp.]|uniref:AmmeMemoRadiSam system radical SAM enzyme n=1 Tax=Clostridium sp. TaxID=1506 RepID=UPI00359F5116
MKVEASFYEKFKDKVHCFLCPHNCIIEDGCFGKCDVRIHESGKLFTVNYGEVTAGALDPIEKKPLHYFKPHSYIFSVGSFGCNFTCDFCQNYTIAQFRAKSEFMSKNNLIDTAVNLKNNIGIAFTYNEPTIWYEYVYDCARLVKEKKPYLKVVLVTNGYIKEEPLDKLLPYVDAMNIDLKSFNESYYKNLCGGSLKPILKTIKKAAEVCHVEITTLLVSGKNDNLKEVEDISKFLSSIDNNIPLHLSRYFPRYKLKNPPTDINFMKKAEAVGRKYLNRVILGNIY